MSNLLSVTTVLGCNNSMLREGLRHILSSTRFKLHPENLTRGDFSLGDEHGGSSILFILDRNLYASGIARAVSALRQHHAQARIVVLSDAFDLDDMKEAFQSGADGYCLATTGCEALIKYLDLVMLGEIVFPSAAFLSSLSSPASETSLRREMPSSRMSPAPVAAAQETHDSPIRTLSSREAEILQCLMQGAPNKVIARKLDVAEATVKVHIKAILRKIRVANRTQAAMWAVNHFSAGGTDDSLIPSGEKLAAHGLR
ncbi:two-component system nitrate/nitrite response regulator NarL [Microvirga flocculans]|uniref:Two-component system nitrate/nitrite response regulator NarL n=1 Tax=Microvirga flocculans TaxID=217168 RepID=A0A7W6ID95_9HYPH|nr:response regulator transcription factor [Microvirga flocculans]MBB4039011.1 two-component system nitrate/nitrite response regulator NarL [Microvirga flocculans]